tara:strand:+ start:2197 stop:3393 length:1197 start_codon:yes stop_codon:yes gene_type:complete
MKNKYELLAPVGAFPQLRAAITAKATAVYLGLKELNMRATGKNFTFAELKKVRKICNQKNIKVYLTLNTIIYDSELKKVEKIIKKVSKQKLVDAIICWDLSVIRLCRKYNIPFHISTQASVSNTEAAKFYKKLGAERIVLARELNLKQIKKISKIIPIECFIHGAMCVSISGRCFTSQFLQGKSANRGKCTHPCRRPYLITDLTDKTKQLILKNKRVMSAKDLCTLPFINKLKKAGITSFKIEGRNRPAEYVYHVTKIYKKAIDKKLKLSKQEIIESIQELKKVYNRGFSSGFYLKTPTADDFSFSDSGEHTEKKSLVGRIEKYWPKAKVAHVKMLAGKLKLGDEIYIIGKQTGVKKIKIKTMEVKNKSVKEITKGRDVGIKLPKCKKGDEVYLIQNK